LVKHKVLKRDTVLELHSFGDECSIIVYFQRHYSLTPRLGYLYSPPEKFIH